MENTGRLKFKNLFIACVYRVIDALGKFGEHEKWVRARGAAESISTFLSALQTSQVHP